VRDPYWYALFSENVGDPVVETFGDILDLQVRPFCAERSRVFLMVLGVPSFVYSAFRIPVKTEGVVKHVLILCGTFPLGHISGQDLLDKILKDNNEGQ